MVQVLKGHISERIEWEEGSRNILIMRCVLYCCATTTALWWIKLNITKLKLFSIRWSIVKRRMIWDYAQWMTNTLNHLNTNFIELTPGGCCEHFIRIKGTTQLSFERDLWNLKWRENPKNGKPSNLKQKHFSGVLDEPAERFGDHDVPPGAGQLVGRVPLDSGGCTVAVPSFLFLLLLTIIQIIDWFVREKRIGSQ